VDELKLCKNCKWFIPETDRSMPVCNSPWNNLQPTIDLVTGKGGLYTADGAVFCSTQRSFSGSDEHCNASGDWYEPREPDDELSKSLATGGAAVAGDTGLPVGSEIPDLVGDLGQGPGDE
jgi:hypothetical protein